MVMLPLTGGMVGYLYWNNTVLTLETARQSMERVSGDVVQGVDNLIGPVSRVIELAAVMVQENPGAIRLVGGLRFFHELLKKLPQTYGFFVGLDADGSFYQTLRLPAGASSFGPSARPPPEGANYVLRLLDASSGNMADSFIFLGDWGDVKGVDRGPAEYDPRTRGWYESSWEAEGVSVSNAYVFPSTGKPGLTVSHRVATSSGTRIGTVGADITMDTLSAFLDRNRVGQVGRVFILDAEARLIGHPDPEMGVRVDGNSISLKKAREVADRVVADAVRLWEEGSGGQFTAPLGNDRADYMVSFTPFPEEFGKAWVIGVAVQQDEFIGPLKDASIRILVAGFVFVLVAMIIINGLARLLTRPLREIVGETRRIRRFDLEGDAPVESRIAEVQDLGAAVETMKHSLRGFSVYVPRELVRSIVSGDHDIGVGGQRRRLTFLFSDIKGFTKSSEQLAPERLVTSLSRYFEGMTTAIHQSKGIVDKYIGDAIMAIWNAPIADEKHVENACRGMLGCQAVEFRLREEFLAEGMEPYETRFGLHTGEAVIGNVGSSDRIQYTALGAVVNLGSRIEALNKYYGTRLLVSEAIVAEVGERFLFRPIDRVVPVGTTQPIEVFELIGERRADAEFPVTPKDEQRCAQWTLCVELFRNRGWNTAREQFGKYKSDYPDDVVVDVYLSRCVRYAGNPPPSSWNGIEWLSQK